MENTNSSLKVGDKVYLIRDWNYVDDSVVGTIVALGAILQVGQSYDVQWDDGTLDKELWSGDLILTSK